MIRRSLLFKNLSNNDLNKAMKRFTPWLELICVEVMMLLVDSIAELHGGVVNQGLNIVKSVLNSTPTIDRAD
jgi:hypothetical protein